MERPFSKAAMKVVTAQVCQELGFNAISSNAVESLAEITQKYIEELGHASHHYAELAGRTECNFNDVRQSFNDLYIKIDDLRAFARFADNMPFAKAIPEFPLKKSSLPNQSNKGTRIPNILAKEEIKQPLLPHIPECLPPFPPPHTYVHSTISPPQITDQEEIRKKKNKEKKQIEESLSKLNSKTGSHPTANYDSARKPQFTSGTNPYLIPAKIKEEKNSSSNSVPPTPISRDSPYMSSVLYNKTIDHRDSDDKGRMYNEMEENERAKKRIRAEQILDLEYNGEFMDTELPNQKT